MKILVLALCILSLSAFSQNRSTISSLGANMAMDASYKELEIKRVKQSRVVVKTVQMGTLQFKELVLEVDLVLQGNICRSVYEDSLGSFKTRTTEGVKVHLIAQNAGGGGGCLMVDISAPHTFETTVSSGSINGEPTFHGPQKYIIGGRTITVLKNSNGDVVVR